MIQPMLAYKVGKKEVDWSERVFMQPKLDGVRCVISKDGAYSRTGKEWLNIHHITTNLEPFFETYPDVVLDGELYNHELKDDFEKIISLVRKTKPKEGDRVESAGYVQFHCYDYIPGPALRKAKFSSRIVWLEAELPVSYCVKFVNTYEVNKHEEALNLHTDGFLANGYEGSILRLDRPYECKRSYNLQKFKDFHDTEATIVGYEAGKGKFTGLIGKFIMQDDDGVEFGCPIGKGYNFNDRRDILNNVHDYIGKRATFTYFERTKAGSYRHPLYKTLRNYE
jgi:ATP-dependent DNA ligase